MLVPRAYTSLSNLAPLFVKQAGPLKHSALSHHGSSLPTSFVRRKCFDYRPSIFSRPFNSAKILAVKNQAESDSSGSHPSVDSSTKSLQASALHCWPNGGGWIYDGVILDSTVVVEVGAVVHSGASIGPSSRIGSGSVVGPDVVIGREAILSYNVKLQHCTIGDRCVIHNGVAIGQDGFGFFVDEKGNMTKKPQTLRVLIGNDVEIGANSCVDRGSWRDTVIGDQTKLDNLVQIGHNVVIGRCCILCGQVGVGGSATIGDYVVIAGQAGVADHVTIASKVRIAAKSGVSSSIDFPGDYAGFPAIPAKEWRRMIAMQRRFNKQSVKFETST